MCNKFHLVGILKGSSNWYKTSQLYSSSCGKRISIANTAVTEMILAAIRWKFYDVPAILCELCRPGGDIGVRWFEMLGISVWLSSLKCYQ